MHNGGVVFVWWEEVKGRESERSNQGGWWG